MQAGFLINGGKTSYTRLPTEEEAAMMSDYAKSAFAFDSAFSYDKPGAMKGFKSVFKFEAARDSMEADYYKYMQGEQKNSPPLALQLLSFLLTSFSYIFFVIGFPVLYWFCVLKLGESDRLVVFRLGKMSGVKGPGRVVVFPWLDQYKRVDVQASAFSVPPQQFISKDGGIAEMGAEIQYGIVDVETMVREVADHQDILRSLGRSLMIKVLTKKTITQLTKDKRIAAEDINKELNDQVRKWGIDIRMVTLSDAKVLKKPENKSSLNPILQNLGLKQEKQFPSPQQFIHQEYFGEEGEEHKDPNAEALNTLASAVGGYFTGEGGSMNMANMAQNGAGGVSIPPGGGGQQYVSLLGGGGAAPSVNDQGGGEPMPGPSWAGQGGQQGAAAGPPAVAGLAHNGQAAMSAAAAAWNGMAAVPAGGAANWGSMMAGGGAGGNPLATAGFGMPVANGSAAAWNGAALAQQGASNAAAWSAAGASASGAAAWSTAAGGSGVVTLAAKPQSGGEQNFWRGHLETLLSQDDWQMDTDAMGVYQIIITNTPQGRENYMIDISPGCNRVKKSKDCPNLKPCVTVTIESADLLAVLQGTLSPLQAYLTGRITASGDVKKLMFFDKLSARGHKQGSMFNI